MTSKKKSQKRGDFMAQPEDGWLHDNNALACGAGVFYSFPVMYIGSLQILKSVQTLTMVEKTEVCHEAIARTIEFSNIRKKNPKRKPSKFLKEFLADAPYIKVMELKLNVSAQGLATSDMKTNQVISLDEMSRISFAAGGENDDYFFITYIAKDKRENRYCHVFDCGILADDVLATIGQAFNLMQQDASVASRERLFTREPAAIVNSSYRYPADPPAVPTSARPGAPPVPTSSRPAPPISSRPRPPTVADTQPIYDDEESVAQYDNNVAPKRPSIIASVQEQYDNDNIQGTAVYDNGPATGPALPNRPPPKPDVFSHRGADLAGALNAALPSSHLYDKDDDPDSGKIYGDGTTAWNYLQLDPHAEYGSLIAK